MTTKLTLESGIVLDIHDGLVGMHRIVIDPSDPPGSGSVGVYQLPLTDEDVESLRDALNLLMAKSTWSKNKR